MKIQLKPDAPNRVEIGLGPRVYLFNRTDKVLECADGDWPAIERTGFFEPYQEKPAPVVVKKEDKK